MHVGHNQVVPAGERPDHFPYGSLQCLGGFQIALGLIIMGCGAADLYLNYFEADQNFLTLNTNRVYYYSSYSGYSFYTSYSYYSYTSDLIGIFTMASFPIWCGAWFFFTGIFGACITKDRQGSKRCLRNSFQTFSIFTALIFGPVVMFMAGTVPFLRIISYTGGNIYLYVFMAAAGGLGFIEWIVAIVSASVCCCCSTIDRPEPQVIFIAGSAPPQPNVTVISSSVQQQQQQQQQQLPPPPPPMGYYPPYDPYQHGGGPSYHPPNYQQAVAEPSWSVEKPKLPEAVPTEKTTVTKRPPSALTEKEKLKDEDSDSEEDDEIENAVVPVHTDYGMAPPTETKQ